MVWNLVIPAIASVFGAIQGSKQGKADANTSKKRLNQAMGYFGTGRSALEDRIGMAAPLIDQIIEQAYGGFDAQNRLLSDIGDAGYQAISDAHTAGAGRVNQGFLSRGMFGSSAHGGAFRSLASDVARSNADLTSQLASIRSAGLRQSLSQLMGALGTGVQFQMGAGQAIQSSYAQQGQALLGVGHQPAQGVGAAYGQIGAYLGQALDQWTSSGAGAAAGGGAPASGSTWPQAPTVAVPNPLALGF